MRPFLARPLFPGAGILTVGLALLIVATGVVWALALVPVLPEVIPTVVYRWADVTMRGSW